MSGQIAATAITNEDGDVLLRRDGSILWVTLDRPRKANALNTRTIASLTQALQTAEADPAVQAIVLRGNGANFCAGADLEELLAGGPDGVRELMDVLRDLLIRIERSRLAVVAAVHGAARAGGVEIALACDAVVATRSATFGDAHLANDLLPAGGATARLPRTIGWQRAKWLILSAAAIPAVTAQAWGLVLEVSEDDAAALQATAQAVALSMTRAQPETMALAKALLANLGDGSFSEALEAEIVTLTRHAEGTAFRDGVSGFLRKRQARSAS